MTTIAQTPTDTQPTAEHVGIHRHRCRMAPDHDLHVWRDEAHWLLTLAEAEADEWPADVLHNSTTDSRALIAAIDAELSWRAGRGLRRAPIDVGIPRDTLDAIKTSARLELEIAVDVELRGTRTLTGRCIFHDDTTPSLVVWTADQHWKCFGCQLGGDIVTWLMLRHRWTFIEAVKHLSDRTGVELPQKVKPSAAPTDRQRRPENAFTYRRIGGAL